MSEPVELMFQHLSHRPVESTVWRQKTHLDQRRTVEGGEDEQKSDAHQQDIEKRSIALHSAFQQFV